MRLAAIVLAVLTAVGQLLMYAYGEAQLDLTAFGQLAGQLSPWWSRALWAVAWSLPWIVGAAVLAWGPPRSGTAVVIAVATLSLVDLAGVIRLGASLVDGAGGHTDVVGAGGVAVFWLTGVTAGLLAWLARPRSGWKQRAPGPGALFTAAAIAAWLPTAFHSTAFAPPGAPRRIIEPMASGVNLASAELLIYPAVVGLLLLAAPHLRLLVAGAVTLTFAVPQLVSHTASLRAAIEQDMMIPTPAGVLGFFGVAVLVAVGIGWIARGRRVVSDGSTDPDPGAEG